MGLSERKKKILCMAIEEYISSSSPITSGTVKDLTSLDCSTATLRQELNALEAMGYLKQLHTSGGRIPTPQGYRFYVENLLQGVTATNGELEQVREIISSRTKSLNEIVSGIADVISRATSYPTVVVINGYDSLVLTEFKLLPLVEGKVMVLIGTESGYITDTIAVSASAKDCEDASNYLTSNFKGETIGYMIATIDQYKVGMNGEIKAFQAIINTLVGGLKKLNNDRLVDVHREGTIKLLEKSNDEEEAKRVIKGLDDTEALKEAVEIKDGGRAVQVQVASREEGKDYSVVRAPIVLSGKQLASIGVIGPQRMDYSKIAAALKVVVDELDNLKGDD